MTSSFDQVRAAIASDLRYALKSRSRLGVLALRGALNALDNATAASPDGVAAGQPEVARHTPTAAELAAILEREIDARSEAADEFLRLDRADRADALHREADVIRGCLRHLPITARP
jgi:uncharacterized protein YqeY